MCECDIEQGIVIMDWSEFLNPRNKAALQSLNSIDVFERKKLLRNTINTALNAINCKSISFAVMVFHLIQPLSSRRSNLGR